MDLFLTVLVFFTIVVAFIQDMKRREVDNWLNLFLLFGSATYIFYSAMFGDVHLVFLFAFIICIMFVIMNIFYYGRVFGGGDAGLLFAMSAFFIGVNFTESMLNIGLFIILLMISGSIYGIFYSSILYIKNIPMVNRELVSSFKKMKFFIGAMVAVGIFLFLFGIKYSMFYIFGLIIIGFPFLFIFAKSLEKVSMTKKVSGKDLREGDWLVKDERVGNRTIKASWEGISEEEALMLKGKKNIWIKEGLPFVPAFLIAFIFYVFSKDWLWSILF